MKPALASELAKSDPRAVRLTRREFWDVFTDYTVLKGDAWLSLPLSVFNVFDDGGTGTVDALEVFLMMSLFSDGAMDEALHFCFTVFDTDHSGEQSGLAAGCTR